MTDEKADRIIALLEAIKDALVSRVPEVAPRAMGGTGGGSGAVFPFGRNKGQPVKGAARADLEYHAAACRKSLADPGKARWHDKERALLAAIEAELGGGQSSAPPPAGDEEYPF